MGLLDSFDIFELLGFGEATGLELLFAASALVGGILFLLWFALMMIGGVAADIFEGLLGMEGVGDLGADASFKALTFQGLMAFMMFFGLAGLYTLKSTETSTIGYWSRWCGGFRIYVWDWEVVPVVHHPPVGRDSGDFGVYWCNWVCVSEDPSQRRWAGPSQLRR